uniref:GP-PDE domain-containing protein n=1 Tax=Thermofilum adornatum TaxID=1365176 RepID=A0A7C1GJT8_9CREN
MARKIFIVAHRGSSTKAPENTLPAFEQAIKDGADFVETDVYRTRDGAIVCIHDSSLKRTTNGEGFVFEKTIDYLRSLDAGSWFSEKFKGVQVPLLEEYLDIIASSNAGAFIEIKMSGIEEEVLGKVLQWGLEDRTVILSGNWGVLLNVKRLVPGIPTLADLPNPTPQAILSAAKVADIVSIHSLLFEEQFSEIAHRKGLLVNVWNINTPEEALSAVENGADFITADNPELIRKTIGK